MDDRFFSDNALLVLADELMPTSPGFAGRLRDFATRLQPLQDPIAFAVLADALVRVIRLEGVAREAGLALLTLETDTLLAIEPAAMRAWGDAICRIGGVSVRAAQAFGGSALAAIAAGESAGLTGGEGALRLESVSSGLRDFTAAHSGDPIVNRCAAMLGETLGLYPAAVSMAWLHYAEAVAFVPRRPHGVLRPLPAKVAIDDGEFADLLNIVAACAPWDVRAAPKWFDEAPQQLAGVPAKSRRLLLAVLVQLGGDAISVFDLLRGAGPVLRRLPQATRWMVLDLALEIARAVPTAAPRFVRSVLRVGEAVGFGHELESFVREGISLSEMHTAAAEAFFSLESRGAKAFLARHDAAVRFEDIEAMLRGYLRILERRAPHLVAVEMGGLFPHLEAQDVIPVNQRAGTFPTWEENFSLVKLQATLATLWTEAGTREFQVGTWLEDETEGGFPEFYARFELPEAAAGILAHLEAVRLAPVIAERFPGLAADLADLRGHAWAGDRVAAEEGEPAALLFLALGGDPVRVEFSVKGEGLAVFAAAAQAGTATIYDAATETARMSRLLEAGELIRVANLEDLFLEDPTMAYLLDDSEEDGTSVPGQTKENQDGFDEQGVPQGERTEEMAPAPAVDPEMLRAYLEQQPDVKVMRAEGPLDATGLFVSGLSGGGGEAGGEAAGHTPQDTLALARGARESKGVFVYDEWDHEIGDYRVGWCQVHELGLRDDDPSFFSDTLARYQDVLPEVRRQFQRVKPEGYRTIRGLLDGEDFDLDAVVLARTDLRARLNPATRLYTQRQREERDVATLFLLDMSASTDEEVEEAETETETGSKVRGRRVIDIQKEALVIMSQALEEIGDLFAIYGFSGHGRDQVELFDVKNFNESLSLAAKSRLGAVEPQRSTRMGPAIRHAIRRLAAVSSRSKHLILLSDGFPQDFDYGSDRRSNLYGLRDTAQALREAEQAGISTFCITVDRAGHDYLREMCDSSNYLVIDDIAELPLELPKIYSRATRGG
ncbi:MAG: VWA domain-containing protein [Deltaproteobacteria bacterium]